MKCPTLADFEDGIIDPVARCESCQGPVDIAPVLTGSLGRVTSLCASCLEKLRLGTVKAHADWVKGHA